MLDFCLKCNICYTQCPVIKKEINFPGPKYLGPELERQWLVGGNAGDYKAIQELSYCTNCQQCNLACPHGVKPAYFNLKHKSSLVLPLKDRARDWFLANIYIFGGLGKTLAPLTNTFLQAGLLRGLFENVGITGQRPLPMYDRRRIKVVAGDKPSAKKAVYFIGCYASYFDTGVAGATIKLLQHADYQVEIAPLKCCGTPLLSNGFLKQARRLAEINVARLLAYLDKGYKVVTSCPSCALALKEEYKEIFAIEGSQRLAAGVWDVGELLEAEGIKAKSPIEGGVYYHVPCHLKAQSIGLPFARMMEGTDNLLINYEWCCGMAGTFGYKKEKYNLSLDMGSELFRSIKESRYRYVITDCGMCKLQIEHGTGYQVLHPVQLIEKSLAH
ncbi:anaerobic glycerol-3-phosphate dehydrogenase subunit C [Neomoorella glycerini]|nr:anaerobic glycerol-3-phosphate dehydrogenase subunit C [Moorella glycerini]